MAEKGLLTISSSDTTAHKKWTFLLTKSWTQALIEQPSPNQGHG